MVEQKSIKVSLLGKTFSIVTDESSQLIEQAAARVNSLTDEIKEKTSGGSELAKVAFVSLQVSIELEKKQQELAKKREELAAQQQKLSVKHQELTAKHQELLAAKQALDTKHQELTSLKKQTSDVLGRLENSLGKCTHQ